MWSFESIFCISQPVLQDDQMYCKRFLTFWGHTGKIVIYLPRDGELDAGLEVGPGLLLWLVAGHELTNKQNKFKNINKTKTYRILFLNTTQLTDLYEHPTTSSLIQYLVLST